MKKRLRCVQRLCSGYWVGHTKTAQEGHIRAPN
jgi:hypothetical protein